MAVQNDNSLGGEATFSGKAAARPQRADVSLGDERTLGGGDAAGLDTVIDDIEVVDLEARYRVEGTLGQGGMGAVLLATDTRLDRKVAIKRILGEAAGNRMAVQRFLTEAKAIAALNHPNIVQIYDYGRAKDGPFLIMEFVDGGSLLDLCRETSLPIDRAIDLVCQLCDGLGVAHEQGIVHRDIKPANILINRAGLPKLTDFGLAKAEANDHGMTMTGAVMGTPDFMPPEQRRDAAEIDHRSDLWSLAATFYQMVTGRSPKVIRLKEVPAALHAVFEKALEDHKEQRFQSAGEFRDAIRAAVGLGGDKASVLQGKPLEGQCPACGTISNDLGRKFCRQCQGPLRTPCLQCDKDMPVWDTVCGECGGRQSEVAETRKASLVAKQQEAKKAYKSYDFATAINIGEQLIALRHPRLAKFTEWGRTFVDSVKEQRSRLLVSVAERLAEAQQHRQAFDYAAAIRAIELIPAPLRDSATMGILAECRNNRDEVMKLMKVIADRIKAKDLDGLLARVERAVVLQGNRADLQRLLVQLRQREAKQLERRSEEPTSTAKGDSKTASQSASAKEPPPQLMWQPAQSLQKFLVKRNHLIVVAGLVASVAGLGVLSLQAYRAVSERASTLRNSIGMQFRLIPAGRFTMGYNESGAEDDETPHRVTLSKPFLLGIHEVTNKQWKQVMGASPSESQDDESPVEQVSWEESVEFCRRLSALPAEKAAGREYRLPTEAEWEYAARAGATTKYSFGDDASLFRHYGWFEGNSEGQKRRVGLKKPNAWGLYDMHGNVYEWCNDWYGHYPSGSAEDPTGPLDGGERIHRGGTYRSALAFCRVSLRRFSKPQERYNWLGFRVAMNPAGPSNRGGNR